MCQITNKFLKILKQNKLKTIFFYSSSMMYISYYISLVIFLIRLSEIAKSAD